MSWLVVHTKVKAEEQAAQQLRQQGYEVFLPRLRRRKRRRDGWQWVIEPLFPRYLFVDVALGTQDVAAIRSTVGVVDLVRFGFNLVPVPDSVILYLKQCEEPLLGARNEDKWPHKPGDVVAIVDGPFAGLKGVYQMPRDADRALLLIELLGRQNSVLIQHTDLGEAVGAG